MARKTIFLESAFWDKFSECYRAILSQGADMDSITFLEKIPSWVEIYKFISRSDIYTDKPLSELEKEAENDEMLKKLLKKNGDGLIEMEYSELPFPNLETNDNFNPEDYSAIYLTYDNHCIGASKLGVLNISIDTIWNQHSKFIDSGESVNKDTEWVWKNMKILGETSNGIIIIDNYILSPYRDNQTGAEVCTASFNLRELLKLLLPDSRPQQFPISIFYYDDSKARGVRQRRKDSYNDDIQRFVKSIRPSLDFVLELFPSSTDEDSYRKDFHDRAILTNNIWVSSEAGFDLLRRDTTRASNSAAIKTTKTHGLYLGFGDEAASWLASAYDQLLSEAKRCLIKYNYTSQNRLLE